MESTLFNEMGEKRRVDQLSINCRWLSDKIECIHRALCPGKFGTWQQRAEQAVEAAERLSATKFPSSVPVVPSPVLREDIPDWDRFRKHHLAREGFEPNCRDVRVITLWHYFKAGAINQKGT